MAFGWDDAAAAVPGLINLGMQIFGQNNKGRDQMSAALEQLYGQQYLNQKQMELATAGRTDARGTSVNYVPGKGWVTNLGPEAATQQSMSDQLMKDELIRQMVQGEPQRNREGRARTEASAAAEPLLREFTSGYSAPSKSGVRGKRVVSNVTGAAENADNVRGAATSTALRQGGSSVPLGANLSSLDRNATAGIRTALARGQEEGDQMYDAMYKSWAGNKLDPYSALSSRASGTPSFRPVDVGGDAATSLNQAATIGGMRGGGNSEALARGYAGLPAAIAARQYDTPSYDLFAAGIANMFRNGMKKSTSTIPTYVDNEYSGRTSSGNTYG